MIIALVGALTRVTTTAEYPLGSVTYIMDADYGPQYWRYIFNNSGAEIAANLGVMQENGTTAFEVSLSTTGIAAQRLYGATQHAIAAASYGWVLADGIGDFASDGSTTADTPQLPAANGQFSDGTVGTHSIVLHAMATESPAGAGGLFRGIIRCL